MASTRGEPADRSARGRPALRPEPTPDDGATRLGWAAGVWGAVTAWGIAGASPAHDWLDAGEMAAASVELGVLHPPGTPGYTLLAQIATAIPLGALGFRVACGSAALAGVGIALAHDALLRRARPAPLRIAFVLWLLAGLTLARHLRVAEIYGLALALAAACAWGLDPQAAPAERPGARALAFFAGTWGALAFGDLRVALGPLLAWAWLAAARRAGPARARRVWLAFAGLGALTVLALPLASAREPWLDWGSPDSPGRLLAHLRADSIRAAFADEIAPAELGAWLRHARAAWVRATEDLGPFGPLLGLVGLGLAAADPGRRAAALGLSWIAAAELAYAAGINPMGGADRQTGVVLVAVLGFAAIDQLGAWARGPATAWASAIAVAGLGIAPALWLSWPDATQTRSWMAHAWTRHALDAAPGGALVLVQSDDLAAGALAAQVLEGRRPDLTIAVAQHLHKPPPARATRGFDQARRVALWQAAARDGDEGRRVSAAIGAWRGPVALERPGFGVFGAVAWWAGHGDPILAVAPGPRGGPPPIPHTPNELGGWARAFASAWLGRAAGPRDRARISSALAGLAAGIVAAERGSPLALARAEAVLLVALGEVDGADAGALISLGAIHDRLGRPDAAIVSTERALELEPDRPSGLRNLALYLARGRRDPARALALARRAIELEPHQPAGWLRLAEVHDHLGEPAEAERARRRAAELQARRAGRGGE